MASGFEPEGRVAVVTGGASGIGRALCRRLVAAGAAHVVVADIDGRAAQELAVELGGSPARPRANAIALDVSDENAVAGCIDKVETQTGPIGIWFSNAGIHRGAGLGEADDWTQSLSVNLLGHVYAARHAIPRMAARACGHFVITASAAGLLTDPRSAPYAASKHAAVALAEWLAIRHGTDGVAVSCLCPQAVRTAMTRPDSVAAARGTNVLEPDEVSATILTGLREGRFMILPHPEVAEYERRRSADRERWLGGMRRAFGPAAQATEPAARPA